MTSDDEAAVRALVGRLEATWNAADPTGFAAELTPDADFVNVRGDYHSGRAAVAHLHVPAGPLAGDISAIPSIVLVREGGAWRIASFHNTARLPA